MVWIKRILVSLSVIVALLTIGFIVWATLGEQEAEALAQAALQPDTTVIIEMEDGYILRPEKPASTGFIFYSGGLVTPEAYAAHLRPIAEAGYTVFAPQLTLNLAFFNIGSADSIIESNPQIDNWVISGHSLGGAMAAQYTLNHDDEIDGLVLWGSLPAQSADLSNHQIDVASIFGSSDGLAQREDILASRSQFPSSATFVEIIGGNHAQFGDYGEQAGDNLAEISLQQQLEQTVQATLDLINRIDGTE